jgi:hypothetical protein
MFKAYPEYTGRTSDRHPNLQFVPNNLLQIFQELAFRGPAQLQQSVSVHSVTSVPTRALAAVVDEALGNLAELLLATEFLNLRNY